MINLYNIFLFKELIGWQEGQTFWEYIGEVVMVNLATLLWGVFAFVILYFGAKFLAWFVNCDAIKALDEAQKKRNQKERQKREEMIKASNNPVYKKIMSRYSAWRDMFDNMG